MLPLGVPFPLQGYLVFLASSLLLTMDGRVVGFGPQRMAPQAYGDDLGVGLPISLEAGVPEGPRGWEWQQG